MLRPGHIATPRRAVNGQITKAACPAFSQTVTRKTTYSRSSDVQRLQALARSLSATQGTQAYKVAASLMYAGQKQLDSGDVSTNVWSGQVGSRAWRQPVLARLAPWQPKPAGLI